MENIANRCVSFKDSSVISVHYSPYEPPTKFTFQNNQFKRHSSDEYYLEQEENEPQEIIEESETILEQNRKPGNQQPQKKHQKRNLLPLQNENLSGTNFERPTFEFTAYTT